MQILIQLEGSPIQMKSSLIDLENSPIQFKSSCIELESFLKFPIE